MGYLVQRSRFTLLVTTALLTAGSCQNSRDVAPVLALVYAGPPSLPLRAELPPQAPTVTSVTHGTKLDVLQVRRRFVRVRAPNGIQGWTDARNLLNDEQMKDLADLAESARSVPSMGEATVFSALNMHGEPDRRATSFYQITEGVKVDVLDHQLAERAQGPAPPVTLKIQKPVRVRRNRPKRTARSVPPRGSSPILPEDWLALSQTDQAEEERKAAEAVRAREEAEAALKPKPVYDHWNLVRTKDGKAGWVLARSLIMAIPDEVAQYAEGARITSFFAINTVQDGDQTKHWWLWTTMRDGEQNFDFDSWRVFIWNLRRHRYETSYIERKVEGFYPVETKPGRMPSFTLILRDEEGVLYRHTFAMDGYITRRITVEAVENQPEESAPQEKDAKAVP